jgi:hypothetical protein
LEYGTINSDSDVAQATEAVRAREARARIHIQRLLWRVKEESGSTFRAYTLSSGVTRGRYFIWADTISVCVPANNPLLKFHQSKNCGGRPKYGEGVIVSR